MTRWTIAAVVVAGLVCGGSGLAVAALTSDRAAETDDRPSLAGRWTLNRQLSQFPSDLGFGMDLVGGPDTVSGGGRGSGGGGLLAATFQVGIRFTNSKLRSTSRKWIDRNFFL